MDLKIGQEYTWEGNEFDGEVSTFIGTLKEINDNGKRLVFTNLFKGSNLMRMGKLRARKLEFLTDDIKNLKVL